MKKLMALVLSLVMALPLMAGAAEGSPETVTVKTRNGAGEIVEMAFPYHPQRLAVMDLGALDILDNIGHTENIVGIATGSSIDYLQDYVNDTSYFNLGSVRTADLEAVMESEPDVIFVGGRLSEQYDELIQIAPVYMMYTDLSVGVVESTSENAKNIAAMFGAEDRVDALMEEYDARIDTLRTFAEGKTAVVGMVNAGGFGVLGNDGRCSIIGRELGFQNVGVDADINTSAHGNEASFEFLLSKNPDYIFAMDRDAAIGTEGAQLAAEVMDNEIVAMTDAAQNGNIVILAHPNVWYTAEGGITALGIMLSDVESAVLP